MKRGFTLIELLVVIGMLAILIGAVGSSVAQARKRALIVKSTQDIKEMTNAILAFENYAKDRSLAEVASDSWKDADEGSVDFLLGGRTSATGARIPVLYNAQVRAGAIRDSWGTPYQFKIKKAGLIQNDDTQNVQYKPAPSLPNFYRLSLDERKCLTKGDYQ